ncbi:MAG: tripartite tricarboxylate transporter TctB family protein [Pseudomonadota bacterium]
MDPEKIQLRRGDFWTALLLIAVSLFFLGRTAMLPLFEVSAAGVEARWYNSAALVPFLIFGALLALAIALLIVAIRDGGLPDNWPRAERLRLGPAGQRLLAVSLILLAYIIALVPRVDFVLASALGVTALIIGFHQERTRPLILALAAVVLPSAYAMISHFPASEWQAPHDDDWVTLAAFLMLTLIGLAEARLTRGRLDWPLIAAPMIGVVGPLLLVCAMAFGFRQNVPNSGGLLFSQIQYHYYVTLKPLWSGG